MAKALMGTHVSPSSLRLLDEVRALRQRVAELEAALASAEAARDRASAGLDESEQPFDRPEPIDAANRQPART